MNGSVNISHIGNFSNSVSANKSLRTSRKNSIYWSDTEGTALIAINLTLAVAGTIGNILIIFAVLSTPKIRRKPSNIFLLSLAVADLMVTMAAQPLFVVTFIFFNRCSLAIAIKTVLNSITYLSLSSSLFHLVSISIDRLICTVKPFQHRFIIKRWYKKMLVVCWSVAVALSVRPFVFQSFPVVIPHTVIPYSSFAIMLGSYGTILYKIKSKRMVQPAALSVVARRSMENKVSATIAIVILLFFVCWISYATQSLIPQERVYWCGYVYHGPKLQPWFRTVIFSNSLMNFLVYSLRIRRFRLACRRILMTALRKCWKKVSLQMTLTDANRQQ